MVTEPTAEKATNKAPRSIVTLTLTGVPVSLNGQLSLADAIVTVDFADLAARRIGNAVSSPRKTSLMLGGAMVFGKGMFLNSALNTSTDGVNWTASGGLPENVTQINGGIFTTAVYGSNAWVGGSLFETFLFHP